MPKRLFKLLGGLFTIALAAAVLIVRDARNIPPPVQAAPAPLVQPATVSTSTAQAVETNAKIIRVVDGDTIAASLDAEPGEWKIRLLGIDTPEVVDPRKPVQCFGHEASNKLKALLTEGLRIRLEGDPQADERDKYGRLLRNVILADGTDVNAMMVRDGYAYAYLSFPLTASRKRELKVLQDKAQVSNAGLWSPSTCSGKLTI